MRKETPKKLVAEGEKHPTCFPVRLHGKETVWVSLGYLLQKLELLEKKL